jgi:(E)-4-hydroxy-3-methylbut-2-enyl-diphosphate synthase
LLKDRLTISGDPNAEFLPILLTTATNIGSLLCDGIRDAILVQGEEVRVRRCDRPTIFCGQAGTRIFKTDFIACLPFLFTNLFASGASPGG